MQSLCRALLAAALVLTPLAARAEPPPGSGATVLYDGAIFTGDPGRPAATAIAIRGERVVAVGDDAAVLAAAGEGARRIDLHGRRVVPGINDAHVHVLAPGGIFLNSPDFVPGAGPTLGEVKAMIAGTVGHVPPGAWLFVFMGEAVLDDPAATRFALDAVSGTNPVWLQGWTGHGTLVNTAGLGVLGIGASEPDVFGGHYDRVAGSAVITGMMREYAQYHAWRAFYAAVPDAVLTGLYQAAAAQAVQYGYTSWQDIPVGLTQARALKVVAAANLPLRVRQLCVPLDLGERCENPGGAGPVRTSGIKWITDGTPIERHAFLTRDYADRPGERGEFNFAAGPLAKMLEAGQRGAPETNQLVFHGVGDGAVETVLSALETNGGGARWGQRRTRLEHADLLFSRNFGRMRATGAMVVQNARHLTLTAAFAQRFTPDVFAELEPLRSLLDAGIPLALGTDAIGQVASPWVDVFLAAIHPTHPAEALTVPQAISAFTSGAAYAEFEEHEKGTLAPGMLADLAVLSQDPLTVPLPQVPATTSVLTMVGGRIVWDTGAVGSP
jgi:predicted amidohydrolase YtcJ